MTGQATTGDACTEQNRFLEQIVTCELSAGHDAPTDDLPQGTPHESSQVPDPFSGGPRRWWS